MGTNQLRVLDNNYSPAPLPDPAVMRDLIGTGDLEKLSDEGKVSYYVKVCQSLRLNPYTQPFQFIKFPKGGMKLYARKDAAEQLRKLHGISIVKLERSITETEVEVKATATDASGREDSDYGIVSLHFFNDKGEIQYLTGEARANAIMKAATKAKRRVTLSICGLGMLDETEAESIPGARIVSPPPIPRQPAIAQQPAVDFAAYQNRIATAANWTTLFSIWRELVTSAAGEVVESGPIHDTMQEWCRSVCGKAVAVPKEAGARMLKHAGAAVEETKELLSSDLYQEITGRLEEADSAILTN